MLLAPWTGCCFANFCIEDDAIEVEICDGDFIERLELQSASSQYGDG